MAIGGGAVLIADADPGFREFASRLLRSAGFQTTEAVSGTDAVEAARTERPAMVLLDVGLPGVSGFEVCQQLRDEFGDDLPVVFVSGERTAPVDRAAGLLVGGDDYLVKPVDRGELLARTRRLISRSRGGRPVGIRARVDVPLTERELQVLQLLAKGLGSKEIARELVISPKTVASHVQHVVSKLGVHSRAEAIAVAYRDGFVAIPTPTNPDVSAHLRAVAL